ncbi:MAG TPA: HAD-IC family P-type ATPase, partial [Rhizobiaceae bacterium]|nr:HAD-IC family P-type ATPase [Rhizobiaceae bacterium]
MTDSNPAFHAEPVPAVLATLGATTSGLSETQVAARLAEHGPNRLPPPPKRPVLLRFLSQFNNVLIYVLLGAALLTAGLDHLVDSSVILAVVLINAAIGFVQEGRAEQAMQAIQAMLTPHANVLRDGKRQEIDAAGLVPGDIVLVEAGDRVPADLRLIEANGLRVEEAVLTGESVPVDKQVAPVAADAPLGDRTSMAFSGTLVAHGAGRGVVVATGRYTQVGRITGLLGQVETLVTPLVAQMDVFARWLTALILVIAALLLAFGYFLRHMPFVDLFMAVVGLSVAAIPEGLPAVMTIVLAVAVTRMARRNAIVRKLPAIETVGAVSVICTDKTGTLTRNEMLAATVAVSADMFSLSGTGYEPAGAITLNDRAVSGRDHLLLERIARAATLCNDAAIANRGDGWAVEGDPMEGAPPLAENHGMPA